MDTNSVETAHAQTQEPRSLGQWENGVHTLRLIESNEPGVLHLRRYRKYAEPPYSVAAAVTHAGGVVSDIRWDPWHQENAPASWKSETGHWVRAMVARDWADR
jgi:hypothetical protein